MWFGRPGMRRSGARTAPRTGMFFFGYVLFFLSLVVAWLVSGRVFIFSNPVDPQPVFTEPVLGQVVSPAVLPRSLPGVAPNNQPMPSVALTNEGAWLVLQQELDHLHEALPQQLNYDWYRTEAGAMMVLSADPLFAPGDFVLRAESVRVVQMVAEVLANMPVLVTVAGHVDDRGLAREAAWQVTSRRAAALVSELERRGIAGQRLSAVGYGGTLPQVPNETADQRASNRRMELILSLWSDIPKVESAPADTLDIIYTE